MELFPVCDLYLCILATLPQPPTGTFFFFLLLSRHQADMTLSLCTLCLSVSSCFLTVTSLRFVFLFKGYQEISLCNTSLLFEKLSILKFYLISKTIFKTTKIKIHCHFTKEVFPRSLVWPYCSSKTVLIKPSADLFSGQK